MALERAGWHPRFWSLRRKLALFLLSVILVFAAALAVVFAQALADARESNQRLVDTYAHKMRNFFSDQLAQILYDGISTRYGDKVQTLFDQHAAGRPSAPGELRRTGDGERLKGNLVDILLMDTQGEVFYCQSGVDVGQYQGMWDERIRAVKPNRGEFFPVLNANANAYLYSGPTFLYAVDVYRSHFASGPRERLGVLVYLCNLTRASSFVLDNDELAIEVRDGEGRLLLSNRNDADPEAKSDRAFNNTVRYTGWNLRVSMIRDRVFQWDSPVLRFSLLVILFSALCVLGIYIIIHESVQKPILSLTNQLQSRGFFGKLRVSETHNHEIGTIERHINDMLERQDLLRESNLKQREVMYQLDMDRKQAELSALRSQINPHFLYNSLECVRGMAVALGAKSIEEIAVSLGNLFRYSIKGQNSVRVRDELKMIFDYFRIVHHRFPGRYRLSIDIAPELRDALIPKMILQPIVENAMSHGLEALPAGNVWVRGVRRGDELWFSVENDGVPLSEERLAELQRILDGGSVLEQTERIGLLNICQRIRNQYGGDFGLRLEGREEGGLRVILRLPMEEAGVDSGR